MDQINIKIGKIRQTLIDKLYYNDYYEGLFLMPGFDYPHPFLIRPRLLLYYHIDSVKTLIPEKFNDKIILSSCDENNIIMEKGTIIKPIECDINSESEFKDLETEFLDILLELVNELPENPAWKESTYPIDIFTKISSSTIN